MASTIRDVAARAGLSVGTVSKYINGKTVKESTRLAIEEAIKELDFHPNNIAKGLRNAKSFSVILFTKQVQYFPSLFPKRKPQNQHLHTLNSGAFTTF